MKLLIVSDSHQEISAMAEAVRREMPDAVLHLGDHYGDAQKLAQQFPDLPLHAVEGNTDYAPGAPVELLLCFEGKRVYMTHGHLFGVKMGLHGIKKKGDAVAADLVLFGHTHQPLLQDAGDMTLMNPGTIGRYGRGLGRNLPTYGLVEIVGGEIKCCIRNTGE